MMPQPFSYEDFCNRISTVLPIGAGIAVTSEEGQSTLIERLRLLVINIAPMKMFDVRPCGAGAFLERLS